MEIEIKKKYVVDEKTIATAPEIKITGNLSTAKELIEIIKLLHPEYVDKKKENEFLEGIKNYAKQKMDELDL
jgi:hypothetical protein